MTTLELTQATTMAIDQAIMLIISENKIDEAIIKLNEAKVCTETMEKMINPSSGNTIPSNSFRKAVCETFRVPEYMLFTKTRCREICNARQVYIYVLMQTYVNGRRRPGCARMKIHTGWDHATCLHACSVVKNYSDTERKFREKVISLRMRLRSGVIAYPDVFEYVGWR